MRHSFIKYSVSWIFQYLSPSCSIYRPTAMFPDMAVNAVLGILECNANVSVFCSREYFCRYLIVSNVSLLRDTYHYCSNLLSKINNRNLC